MTLSRAEAQEGTACPTRLIRLAEGTVSVERFGRRRTAGIPVLHVGSTFSRQAFLTISITFIKVHIRNYGY
jgi:hypothetical protein